MELLILYVKFHSKELKSESLRNFSKCPFTFHFVWNVFCGCLGVEWDKYLVFSLFFKTYLPGVQEGVEWLQTKISERMREINLQLKKCILFHIKQFIS